MEHLTAKRDQLEAEARSIIDAAKADERSLTDDERATVESNTDAIRAINDEMSTLNKLNAERARIADEVRTAVQPQEPAASPEPEATPEAPRVTSFRSVYGPRSHRSWFADKAKVDIGRADADTIAEMQAESRHAKDQMETRDLSTADTAGQELVPPVYLQNRFARKRVEAAVAAGLVTKLPMPAGGRTVTVPIQDGAAAVGISTENNTLTETDATFTDQTATIYMVGGIQDLSLQLEERSEPGADMVLMDHFAKVLAKQVDTYVLDGSNSSQPKGLRTAISTNAVTYTDTSPTFAEAYPKIADAIQKIHTNGLVAPNAIVVHPRRAAKWFSELDSSNRPLAAPVPVGQNVLAMSSDGSPVAAGFSGWQIQGLPVYVDANIPTNDGSGTNEDTVFVGAWDEALLWESAPIFEVDRSIGFKTGSVTIRARQYVAFLADHREASFAKITGSGLATPTF